MLSSQTRRRSVCRLLRVKRGVWKADRFRVDAAFKFFKFSDAPLIQIQFKKDIDGMTQKTINRRWTYQNDTLSSSLEVLARDSKKGKRFRLKTCERKRECCNVVFQLNEQVVWCDDDDDDTPLMVLVLPPYCIIITPSTTTTIHLCCSFPPPSLVADVLFHHCLRRLPLEAWSALAMFHIPEVHGHHWLHISCRVAIFHRTIMTPCPK
jgi:hypothetical protein